MGDGAMQRNLVGKACELTSWERHPLSCTVHYSVPSMCVERQHARARTMGCHPLPHVADPLIKRN